MMKHLEEAFTGTWHMHERTGEVGTGAGDTQMQGLDMNLSVPPLMAERRRTGWEGNVGMSAATWDRAQSQPTWAHRLSLWYLRESLLSG